MPRATQRSTVQRVAAVAWPSADTVIATYVSCSAGSSGCSCGRCPARLRCGGGVGAGGGPTRPGCTCAATGCAERGQPVVQRGRSCRCHSSLVRCDALCRMLSAAFAAGMDGWMDAARLCSQCMNTDLYILFYTMDGLNMVTNGPHKATRVTLWKQQSFLLFLAAFVFGVLDSGLVVLQRA